MCKGRKEKLTWTTNKKSDVLLENAAFREIAFQNSKEQKHVNVIRNFSTIIDVSQWDKQENTLP